MRDLIGVAVPLIEAISSLVIVGGLAWALWTGLRPIDLTVLRREAAEAIVAGLSLKVAAALLNTIRAEDWNSIGILVAIVGIRTLSSGNLDLRLVQSAPRKCMLELV